MGEERSLRPGESIDHDTLITIFKCSSKGGMRRSLRTNSLVLISDQNSFLYENVKKKKDGLWHFVGMGRVGDQSLDYLQNKTLHRSNDSGVKVYLFDGELIKRKNQKVSYRFIGQVLLAGNPYQEDFHKDENGEYRKVFIFPLIEIGKKMKFTDFIGQYEKQELVEKRVLGFPNYELSVNSADNIVTLMEQSRIDTLIGPGGWFLTKTKYFYNPNAKSKWRIGNYKSIVNSYKNVDGKIVFQGQNKYLNPFYHTSITYVNNFNLSNNQHSEYNMGLRVKSFNYQLEGEEKETKIKFIHEENKNNLTQPFFTLLIGPNGTGKSTILSVFQQIILEMYYLAESKKTKRINSTSVKFELSYQLGQNEFQIIKNKKTIKFLKNGEPISFNKNNLPKRLIATAFTINDRFTYQNQEEDILERYQYLGIKSSNNVAKIGETTKNLVQNFIKSSLKSDFLPNLIKMTNFINVKPNIRLVFNTINNTSIRDFVSEANIKLKQNKYLTSKNKKNSFVNIIEFKEIEDFLNSSNIDKSLISLTDDYIIIDFDLNSSEKYEKYIDELNIIWHLYELGLFSLPNIMLKKDTTYFKLEDASSGEAQYFSTMVNILSKIDHNSVIIIDEPESSLHPNWQNKYIFGLKEIFKMYPSCHFIMATHSHFLISDLEPGTSSIISLKRMSEDSTVMVNLHNEDTFGWSVEDVLFNIFGLPTNRNYYVADEIDKILLSISLGQINEETTNKIKRFVDVYKKMKENDPLRDVLKLIFEKVDINV